VSEPHSFQCFANALSRSTSSLSCSFITPSDDHTRYVDYGYANDYRFSCGHCSFLLRPIWPVASLLTPIKNALKIFWLHKQRFSDHVAVFLVGEAIATVKRSNVSASKRVIYKNGIAVERVHGKLPSTLCVRNIAKYNGASKPKNNSPHCSFLSLHSCNCQIVSRNQQVKKHVFNLRKCG
jgi:hypothetical protein